MADACEPNPPPKDGSTKEAEDGLLVERGGDSGLKSGPVLLLGLGSHCPSPLPSMSVPMAVIGHGQGKRPGGTRTKQWEGKVRGGRTKYSSVPGTAFAVRMYIHVHIHISSCIDDVHPAHVRCILMYGPHDMVHPCPSASKVELP